GSFICLIEDGRFYYRGRDAVRLSDRATLEEIAKLLWLDPAGGEVADRNGAISSATSASAARLVGRRQIAVISLRGGAPATVGLTRRGVAGMGWRILRELGDCVAVGLPSSEPIHVRLAAAWNLRPTGADLVRRCLVLIADHELNASTYVARCVASTGASPYA